jgi:hypothetical protein
MKGPTQDTLIIASAAFCKSVTVLFLDREEYLNETYISACKNPEKDRIMLAKAGKKYYAVLKTETFQTISDLREVVIEEVFVFRFSCLRLCSRRRLRANPGRGRIRSTTPITMKSLR